MAGYKDYVLEFKLGDGTTHKIPFRVPMGENGGYYTPEIEQKADNLIEIRFTPSEPGMPAVDPVAVELPVGQGSGGNVVYDKEQVLTKEEKEQALENIGAVDKTAVENASLTKLFFETSINKMCFEGVETKGFYIKIPDTWWLRGSLTNNKDYSTICVNNRATSPSGVEDCIFVPHNSTLIFNPTTLVYEIVKTTDIEVGQIPIFIVGLSNNVEVIVGGIGAYCYESYKYSISNNAFFTMVSKAYFEEAENGLYVKSAYYWSIRGIESATTNYSTICVDNRATSPTGVEDCIFIPSGNALAYNRITKTYKIISQGATSVMDSNIILIFATGQLVDREKYGVVGGIGLHEYQTFVNIAYNYTKNIAWEVGSLHPGVGTDYDSITRFRSDFILVGKGTRLKVKNKYKHLIYIYDFAKTYQSDLQWTNGDIVVPNDCYIRILVSKNDDSDISTLLSLISEIEIVEYIPPTSEKIYELPSVFTTQYETAKETIRSNQLQAGRDGVTFVWLTDLHWQNNWRNSPKIVKHIVKDMGIRNIVLTGDYIGGGEHDTHIELLRDCVESFNVDNAKTFVIAGNHDYNVIGAPDETHYFTHNETEALIMGGVDDRAVSGNGCYYYYDMPKNRTRLVFLDSALESSGGYATMDSEQLSWFDSVLASTPDGYHILVFQHIIYGSHDWSTPLLEKLFLSYQGEAVISACDTHNAKGGTQVVAIFGGHIHIDYNTTSPGGIPVIMMDSDSKQTYSGIGNAANTVNSQCVDIVTVDYENEKVSCVRIGRGADRVITL